MKKRPEPSKPAPFPARFGQRIDPKDASFEHLLPGTKPGDGTVLYTANDHRRVTLSSSTNNGGGEGLIFASDLPDRAIKVYLPEHRNQLLKEKLQYMTRFTVDNPRICWPREILEDKDGAFMGFSMPLVRGKTLSSLGGNYLRIQRDFPHFDRKTQVNMIIEILEQFQYLHSLNLLIGDVKLENIMFSPDDFHITLVDMDSIQIDRFPCVTSTESYDSPEVVLCLGRDHVDDTVGRQNKFCVFYHQYYRGPEQEYFSIAVLLFRFLFLGLEPYSDYDWSKDAEEYNMSSHALCAEQKFAFGVNSNAPHAYEPKNGEKYNKKILWSHLPSFLKQAFFNCFAKNQRYSPDRWLVWFRRYRDLLESEQLQKADPECNSIFPEEAIDFRAVSFRENDSRASVSFSLEQAVGQIIQQMGGELSVSRATEIAQALEIKPEHVTGRHRFRLVYNMGVLKKVSCEPL